MTGIAFLALSLLVVGSILDPPGASAADSLRTSIVVHEDSSVTITDIIRIESGNNWFGNEFDRHLPTARRKLLALRYSEGFQLLECLRDGRPETYKVFGDKGLMIRVGDFMNTSPVPQIRTYTLKYRLRGQVVSTNEGDRLTWTVTDRYWGWWPIDVSASVCLPGDASALVTDSRMLIGRKGKEETVPAAGLIDNDGLVRFTAPRRLDQNEGLTISLTWPKGYLKGQGAYALIRQIAVDNRGLLIGIGGLALLLTYYGAAWTISGRGPAEGTMVVLYAPPYGMSPAVLRYIWKMGYDDRCFTAALLNMAAKGHLKIWENKDKRYIITRMQGSIPLSTDETKIMNQLLPKGGDMDLEAERRRLIGAVSALQEYLRVNFERNFFVGNLRYFGVGLIISGAMVVASGLGSVSDPLDMILFVLSSLILSIVSPFIIVVVLELLKRWKSALASGGAHGSRIANAILFTIVAALFFMYAPGPLSTMVHMTSPYILVLIAATVAINYAFYQLMKAPTRAGRKVHDDIEGFKKFLLMTEKDRMNLADPPGRTPELFTKYIPYALALDLEQEWSGQFSNLLGGAVLGEPGSSLAQGRLDIVTIMGNLLRSH